jgi:hypothetical protein
VLSDRRNRFADFLKVDIRSGTIVSAEVLPASTQARLEDGDRFRSEIGTQEILGPDHPAITSRKN